MNIHFILCDPKEDLCREWQKNVNKLQLAQRSNFTIFNGLLSDYKRKFDCMVSPANSYCRLDGSYDLVIAKMFSPKKPMEVTAVAQKHCYQKFNGYMPPGTSSIVDMRQFNEKVYDC